MKNNTILKNVNAQADETNERDMKVPVSLKSIHNDLLEVYKEQSVKAVVEDLVKKNVNSMSQLSTEQQNKLFLAIYPLAKQVAYRYPFTEEESIQIGMIAVFSKINKLIEIRDGYVTYVNKMISSGISDELKKRTCFLYIDESIIDEIDQLIDAGMSPELLLSKYPKLVRKSKPADTDKVFFKRALNHELLIINSKNQNGEEFGNSLPAANCVNYELDEKEYKTYLKSLLEHICMNKELRVKTARKAVLGMAVTLLHAERGYDIDKFVDYYKRVEKEVSDGDRRDVSMRFCNNILITFCKKFKITEIYPKLRVTKEDEFVLSHVNGKTIYDLMYCAKECIVKSVDVSWYTRSLR